MNEIHIFIILAMWLPASNGTSYQPLLFYIFPILSLECLNILFRNFTFFKYASIYVSINSCFVMVNYGK